MAVFSIKVGGTALPSEVTALKRGDELLWSESTGRSASTGAMTGSVVAKKQSYTVEWGVLTAAQYKSIRDAIGGDYMALAIEVNGSTAVSCTVYRGAIGGELVGVLGGVAYYRNVSVELVEK